jgi:hypothetical protein
MDVIAFILGGIVAAWYALYFISYYVALFLFKKLIPLKLKYGDKKWFNWVFGLPFLVGFLLDIYFNIVHFSFDLYFMNKRHGLHKTKPFFPFFLWRKDKRLYKLTLTERLQYILDNYPKHSHARMYAVNMGKLLNRYDPNHLNW